MVALICLLSTQGMLYTVEIYFSIQLKQPGGCWKSLHSEHRQLKVNCIVGRVREDKKSPGADDFRSGLLGLSVCNMFCQCVQSNFRMTILKIDAFSAK